MMYVESDLSSGQNSATANFFGAAPRGTTDSKCANSQFRTIEDILPNFPLFGSELNTPSVRSS